MKGGIILNISALACLLDTELGYAELLHTVIHREEFVVGQLVVLLLSLALYLFLLRVLDGAEQLLDANFDNRENEDDRLEYAEQSLGNALLTACEEIGNVDSEDRDGDYHKADSAEDFDKAEADDTADKSAANRLSSVLEELYCVKDDLIVPIGYRIGEGGDKGYRYEREYDS